jgi:hypothetical protein
MTAVVGAVSRGRVAIGTDASVSQGDVITYSGDSKCWRSGSAIIGAAGDWLYLDMLRRIDFPPDLDEHWLRYGLTSMWRRLCSDLGENPDGDALIGALGWLWDFSDKTIVRQGTPYGVNGTAGDIGLGALAILSDTRLRAEEQCRRALVTCERHYAGIRGPFTILTT